MPCPEVASNSQQNVTGLPWGLIKSTRVKKKNVFREKRECPRAPLPLRFATCSGGQFMGDTVVVKPRRNNVSPVGIPAVCLPAVPRSGNDVRCHCLVLETFRLDGCPLPDVTLPDPDLVSPSFSSRTPVRRLDIAQDTRVLLTPHLQPITASLVQFEPVPFSPSPATTVPGCRHLGQYASRHWADGSPRPGVEMVVTFSPRPNAELLHAPRGRSSVCCPPR